MKFRLSIIWIVLLTSGFLVLKSTPYYAAKYIWKDSFEGGIHLVLQVGSKGNMSIDEENTNKIKRRMEYRLKELGVKENRMIVKNIGDRKIGVQLPFSRYNQRTVDILSSWPLLEFKILNKSVFAGDSISFSKVEYDSQGKPFLRIKLTKEGAKKFEKLTHENLGKQLVVILDGKIITTPIIHEAITIGELQLAGSYSFNALEDLEILFNAGAIPAPVKLIVAKQLTKDLWLGDRPTK